MPRAFALLVYVSAWLKCHYPAIFAAALLNSQPMGFYAPAQIVRDAVDHGVRVRAVDVNLSGWDMTISKGAGSGDRFRHRLCNDNRHSRRSTAPILRLGVPPGRWLEGR